MVDAVPETKRLVVVALVSNVFPKSVVEERRLEESELNAPWTVVEPVTLSAEVVAPPLSMSDCPVMSPVFEMVNSEVVANALVEEEMLKSVVGTMVLPVEEAAKMEKVAKGEEVPKPRAPSWLLKVSEVVPVAPKRTVEEALRPLSAHRMEEVAALREPKSVRKLKSL